MKKGSAWCVEVSAVISDVSAWSDEVSAVISEEGVLSRVSGATL